MDERVNPQDRLLRSRAAHDEVDAMTAKPENDKSSGRIAKVMARAGLCSRRAAEEWIAAGRVTVNGEAINSPALNVSTKDRIVVDGKPLPARERTRLFLYNKPRNLVTTHDDPQGRPTIFGALPKDLPRLISVGRLDFTTEGLLLLTNDGGLGRILELPQTGWLRRYRVRAHGGVSQPQLDALRNGVEVEGVRYGAIEAVLDRHQGANVWLTFSIREGKNREVRNVLGHLGLDVNRLIRVSYGPFQLSELPEGGIEEVKTRVLREQLGERVVRSSGADFDGPITMRGDDLPIETLEHVELRPAAETSRRAAGPSGARASRGEGKTRTLSLPGSGKAREGRTGNTSEGGSRSRAGENRRVKPDRHSKERASSPDATRRGGREGFNSTRKSAERPVSAPSRSRGEVKPWDRSQDNTGGPKRGAGPRKPLRSEASTASGKGRRPENPDSSDRATAPRAPRKGPARKGPPRKGLPRDRTPRKR